MNNYKCVTSFLFLFLSTYSYTQEESMFFSSGKEGYKIFRIPAVIRFKKEIIAFAEGRINGRAERIREMINNPV